MIGEVKNGMFVKILDKDDVNFNLIGSVTSVEEVDNTENILVKINDSIFKFTIESGLDPTKYPMKIVFSRSQAITFLNSLEENKKSDLLSNEDLLSEIITSKIIQDGCVDSVIDDENLPLIQVESPKTGKYSTKKKLIGFISGKGSIRLNSNIAYIKGDQLSGMLDGSKFKLTIYENGTLDFEEIDTSMSDPDMIQRIINDICDRDVTGYTKKFVVHGLEFEDEKGKPFYLEIEHKKPIEKIFSIFEEDKKVSLSSKSLSILDDLFGDSEVDSTTYPDDSRAQNGHDIFDPIPNVVESVVEKDTMKDVYTQMMGDSFKSMHSSKVQELKDRVEKYESDLLKATFESRTSQAKADKLKDDLKVLASRIESMTQGDPQNGHSFFVSNKKQSIDKDEKMIEVVNKISPILNLKADVVIELLANGCYEIVIGKTDDISNTTIDDTIIRKISELNKFGTMSLTPIPNKFEYRGDLTWHQLVGKMLRMGFNQNPEFDKLCGSNSYKSETEEDMNHIDSIDEFTDKEFIFAVGKSDNGYAAHITPKNYWDTNHVQYDGHIEDLIDLDDFEEVEEGVFVPVNQHLDLIVDSLCQRGIKPCLDFQEFISTTYTNYPTVISSYDLKSIVERLGYQNLIC